MNPDRWKRVEEIYQSALERLADDRASYVDAESDGDSALRLEVLELLAHAGDDTGELGKPLITVAQRLSDARMRSLEGRTLGNYRIDRWLGSGSMGDVYQARDLKLGRDVALKSLPEAFACEPARVARLHREAQLLAALNHPHIAAIYGLEQCESTHFLVLEFIDGEALASRIKRSPLAMSEALALAQQLADALEAAHEKGIVHRDLKPANIALTRDGRLKVLDFGLAQGPSDAVDSLDIGAGLPSATSARAGGVGALSGTPAYMSPEAMSGREADKRGDVWAFGCILFEMLTGRRAFGDDIVPDSVDRVVPVQPDWSLLPAATPPHVRRLLKRCLQKDRARRLRDAGDARLELEEASATSKDAAPRDRSKAWLSGWTRSLLLGPVALALIITSTIHWRSSDAPAPRVVQLVPLTHSGVVHPNQKLLTDGPRLYYVDFGGWKCLLVSGGRPTVVTLPFASADLQDISPDGSEFLVRDLAGYPRDSAPLWIVSADGGAPRKLGEVNANAAVFTVDGRAIVFADGTGVFTCDKEGTNSRQLLSLQGEVYGLQVSPTGDRMSLSTEDPTSRRITLLEASADGTGLRPLVPDAVDLRPDWRGSWSADGRWFAFSGSHHGARNIWLVDARTHALHQLTSGPLEYSLPEFSRDGKSLFSIGRSRRGELLRYDRTARQFVRMLGGLSAEGVQYSPDGHSISYITYPDGLLWSARADGTERAQLTAAPWRVMGSRWSPDGSRLLFEAQTAPDGPWGLFVLAASGGSPKRLLNATHHEGADWSRDGKSIIFARSGETSPMQVLDIEHGSVADLPRTEGLFYPTRSPSGRYLLATHVKSWTLQLLDLDAGARRPLARGMAFASWSQDEQFVYFNRFDSSKPTMSRIRLAGETIEDMFTLGEFTVTGSWGSWSSVTPDGDVLLTRDTGSIDVYRIDLRAP
jgi:serine/threonine protein kinase